MQAVLAAGERRPGEDDDVEDLAENQRGDGEIDVAHARGKIGNEQRRARRTGKPEQNRQPQIGRADHQQGRRRPVHAKSEKYRMAERNHAGVADQQVGRHRQQAPDQDLGEKPAPEFRQHKRRGDEHRHDHAKSDPIDGGVAERRFLSRHGSFERCGAHLVTVVPNKPVGLKSSVRISATKETMTACDGLTQIEA